MEAPITHKSSLAPVNTSEEVQLEDENDFLVKRRRIELSGSIVQPQQGIGVSGMENRVPDGLPAEVSNGKDLMDVLTGCAGQSSGEVNGHCNGNGRVLPVAGKASTRLPRICTAIGWKEPQYDFEERGPPHNRLFICKVTVHMEGLADTIVECFGSPEPQKKAAKEHAAQAALWCLERFGHVKQ